MPDNINEINIIHSPADQKTAQVADMFNQISKNYDFLNHLLSLGIDKYWRKKVIRSIKSQPHDKILDIATGTGDLAIRLAKLNPSSITGIDISENMLHIAKQKWSKRNSNCKISFIKSSCEQMTFQDNSFHCATIAFGIRNFTDINKSLTEIHRVLIPGGQLVILEFSKPRHKLIKTLYYFYFNRILPFIGKTISKNKYAYKYLPASVAAFPEQEDFCKILSKQKFIHTKFKPYTFGVVTIYQCFADKQ